MLNVFSGNIFAIFAVVLLTGALSFFCPRVLSVFPTKIGYIGEYVEHKMKKSILYSLFISIGFMITLFILGITSKILPSISKWLYLFFCVILMREGMQQIGIVKLGSIIPGHENSFKRALFIGIFGGFLLYRIITQVFNIALGFMASTKLLGIIILGIYAIGQIILLLSLEMLIATLQYLSLYPNTKFTKNRYKLIKIISGLLFIFMGFILAYFGFSYDFLK